MAQCIDMLLAVSTIETAINDFDSDDITPGYLYFFGFASILIVKSAVTALWK